MKKVGYARINSKKVDMFSSQLNRLDKFVENNTIATDIECLCAIGQPGYEKVRMELSGGGELYMCNLSCISYDKKIVKKELEYFDKQDIIVRILDIPASLTNKRGMVGLFTDEYLIEMTLR